MRKFILTMDDFARQGTSFKNYGVVRSLLVRFVHIQCSNLPRLAGFCIPAFCFSLTSISFFCLFSFLLLLNFFFFKLLGYLTCLASIGHYAVLKFRLFFIGSINRLHNEINDGIVENGNPRKK